MQIKYIPAEFDFTVDDETTLAILTNPERYQREFNDLIYNFNLSMLNHVANRMDLPDSIKMEIEPAYQKQHPYLRQMVVPSRCLHSRTDLRSCRHNQTQRLHQSLSHHCQQWLLR